MIRGAAEYMYYVSRVRFWISVEDAESYYWKSLSNLVFADDLQSQGHSPAL